MTWKPGWPQICFINFSFIVPKEEVEKAAENFGHAPVGTGPFTLKEWKSGESLTFERNPNYWNKELPYIDRIVAFVVLLGTSPLAAPANGWVVLSEIRCDGHRCMLEIGDVLVPPHGLAIATAYDDCTNQTPQRLIRSRRRPPG